MTTNFNKRWKIILFSNVCVLMIAFSFSPACVQAQTGFFSKKYSRQNYPVKNNSFVETTQHGYMIAADHSLVYAVDGMGNVLWSKGIGPLSVSYTKILKTMDSNYVLIGNEADSAYSVVCVKINGLGDILWSKEISQAESSFTFSAESTNDGGCIIMADEFMPPPGDLKMKVIKMDAMGTLQWSESIAGGNYSTQGCSIKQLPDLGYIVASNVSDTLVGQPGGESWAALTKLNSSGAVQWTNKYRSTDPNNSDLGTIITGMQVKGTGIVLALAVTVNEKLVIMKTDFSGKLFWQKGYNVSVPTAATVNMAQPPLLAIADGGFLTTGSADGSGPNNRILKIDSTGTIQWSKVLGMNVNDFIQDNDSAYAILGSGYATSPIGGMIRTDAIGKGIDCLNNSILSYLNFNFTVTPSVSTLTVEGSIHSWNAPVSAYPILTIFGCIEPPMGIGETSLNTISVYPNPAISNVTISGLENESLIELYDFYGKRIFMAIASSPEMTLDISQYAKGMYFYFVSNKNHFIQRGKVLLTEK
jgi:hypothetical protein